MRIKLATPLIGEFPRYANVKLPDNAAVIAQHPSALQAKQGLNVEGFICYMLLE